MKFSACLIALALSFVSSVSADTTSLTISGTLPTISGTTTNSSFTPAITGQALSVTGLHSVFGYMSFVGASAVAYNYIATFNNSNPTVATQIASGSATTANYQVGKLFCNVCQAQNMTNTSGVYTYTFQYLAANVILNTTTGTNTITVNASTIADTNVAITNGSTISLKTPTVDALNLQPGKLLYFIVAPNAAISGNVTNATLTFTPTTTPNVVPFTDIFVVGGGACPSDATVTGRWTQSFSALTTLNTSVVIPRLTIGTYWIYLPPSATVKNTLATADTIGLSLTPFGTATCTANNVTGFCNSNAATLKSVVGVAFAGVMAAAFVLF